MLMYYNSLGRLVLAWSDEQGKPNLPNTPGSNADRYSQHAKLLFLGLYVYKLSQDLAIVLIRVQ